MYWAPPRAEPHRKETSLTHVIPLLQKHNFDGSDSLDVDTYLSDLSTLIRAVSLHNDNDQVSIISLTLTGIAKTWWRAKFTERAPPSTFDEASALLRAQFPSYRTRTTRLLKLASTQMLGTITEYIRAFDASCSEIDDMSAEFRAVIFIANLAPAVREAVRLELTKHPKKTLEIHFVKEIAKTIRVRSDQSSPAAATSSHASSSNASTPSTSAVTKRTPKPPPQPCMYCGGPHWNRDCRSRPSPPASGGVHHFSTPTDTSTHAAMVSVTQTTPPVTPAARLYVYPMQINEIPARVILDSGAEMDLAAKHFAEKCGLVVTPGGRPVRGLNATLMPSLGVVQAARVNAGSNFSARVSFQVTELSEFDLLLGMPFLQRHNPTINWTTGQLKIGDVELMPESTIASVCLLQYVPEPTLPDDEFAKQMDREMHSIFAPLFVEELTEMPPARDNFDHAIELTSSTPPPHRPIIRLSPTESDELNVELQHLLKCGFIVESQSPYAAPVFFVKNKSGKRRLVVDYRQLNALTVPDHYALPNIEELLEFVTSPDTQFRYFTKLDLRSGYHQVQITERDRHKTGFRTKFGTFMFRVLPFGLCNAPATFCRLVNSVLAPFIPRCAVAFLDDVLVFSATKTQHRLDVMAVMTTLRQNQLFLAHNKCTFGNTSVKYLGHVIAANSITVDPEKSFEIEHIPEPVTLSELRSFIGACNYYRKFVRDFAEKILPLTELTKSSVKFHWLPIHQQSFELLKQELANAKALKSPPRSAMLRLETDASDKSLGAVLSHEDGVIGFYSRKLTPAEHNYSVQEKELLAIVAAFRHWRHHLLGRPIRVITDHRSIEQFFTQPTLSARQARWMEVFQEYYPFEITYRPGSANVVADFLSRIHLATTASWREAVLLAYERDEHTKQIRQLLRTGAAPEGFQLHENGLILKKTRIVLPNEPTIIRPILYDCHDAAIAAHGGVQRTLARVKEHFAWRGLRDDVTQYVRSCNICQRSKATNKPPSGRLHALAIPSKPWAEISIDFVGPLPATYEPPHFTAIMVVICRLSRMVHFIATHTTDTAVETARHFFDHIVRIHGLPNVIVSDRDTKFVSHFWAALHEHLGTTLSMATAHHQQTNGLAERVIRDLKTILRCYISDAQSDWDRLLTSAEFAINSAVHSTTGITPFEFVYGHNLEMIPAAIHDTLSNNESVNHFVKHFSRNLLRIKGLIAESQERQARTYDQHRSEHSYKIGDSVLLSSIFSNPRLAEGRAHKLLPLFIGPFKVSATPSPLNVTLQLPTTMRNHPTFHVEHLRPYHAREGISSEAPPVTPHYVADQQPYFVEEVVDHRIRGGQPMTLVKWIGRPISDNTWLPAAELHQFEHHRRVRPVSEL